jgi:hypothetical protein
LWVCWFGALSLTRGRVCHLQLLLAFTSVGISGSESRGTREHILLSQIRDFPLRRLLRLAGLRWMYWTLLHMDVSLLLQLCSLNFSARTT